MYKYLAIIILMIGFVPLDSFGDLVDFEIFYLGETKYVFMLIDNPNDFPDICPVGNTFCWIEHTFDNKLIYYIFVLEGGIEYNFA